MRYLAVVFSIALSVILLAVIGCSPSTVVPGRSGLGRMDWGFEPSDIKIKAGETALVNIVLDTRKDSGEFNFTVFRVTHNYGSPLQQKRLPMPKGLEVSIEPTRFTASPYNTYHSVVTIKTTPELPAGEYVLVLILQWNLLETSGGWITINVDQKGADSPHG